MSLETLFRAGLAKVPEGSRRPKVKLVKDMSSMKVTGSRAELMGIQKGDQRARGCTALLAGKQNICHTLFAALHSRPYFEGDAMVNGGT